MRWMAAVAAFAIVAGSMVVAGVGAGAGVHRFGVAAPAEGDEATWRLRLLVVTAGEGVYVDANAESRLARLPPGLLPHAGGLVSTVRILHEWTAGPFSWGMWPAGGTGNLAVPGWQVVHDADGTLAVTVRGDDPRAGAHARDRNATVTLPSDVPGPCGHAHALQGALHDLARDVWVRGACPPEVGLVGRVENAPDGALVRWCGEERLAGQRTLVFCRVGNANALRLWFQEDIPYPVRILSPLPLPFEATFELVQERVQLYLLHDLVAFKRGDGAGAAALPEVAPWAAPRGRWGPDASGTTTPFGLRDAWETARRHPDPAFRDWLAAHPDAQVVRAGQEPPSGDAWEFVAADRTHAVRVVVQQSASGLPIPGLARLDVASMPRSQAPPWDALPSEVPSVRALLERLDAAAPGQASPIGWGFDLGAPSYSAWRGGSDRVATLEFDERGGLVALAESPGPYPAPSYQGPGQAAGPAEAHDPWSWQPASVDFWRWPEPRSAAVAGGLGALAAALVALWPALKAATVGLFSRLAPEQVLAHPARHQIALLVEAEPGIHFQAIARRLGQGRGALDHHLRKLVAGGHVVERADAGYTCYFPRHTDRRLMAAAPILKSDGARRVLGAIVARPGLANQELADGLGMAVSSVHHHVRRLLEAGLLDPQREGRWLRLRPTPLARQALDAFGASPDSVAVPGAL